MTLEDARKEVAKQLRAWWSFDDRQYHTHSWHDREGFIDKELPSLLDLVAKVAALSQAEESAKQFNLALKSLNQGGVRGLWWFDEERDRLRREVEEGKR